MCLVLVIKKSVPSSNNVELKSGSLVSFEFKSIGCECFKVL